MSQLNNLNGQLAQARADLAEALADGADTTPARYAVEFISNEIAAHERIAREAAAASQRAEVASVAEAAAELARQTQAAIAAGADVPGLAELSGEPLPAVELDPAITAACREVSRCQAALERACEDLRPRQTQAGRLSARLSEKQAALDAIKARRAAGDERSSDGADLMALSLDIESLQPLLADANSLVIAGDARPAARAALRDAEVALTRAHHRVAFRASLERLELAERCFLDAFGAFCRSGRACGEHSPWSVFKPDPNMRRAVTGQLLPGCTNPFYE
jgi:hypothetical protein